MVDILWQFFLGSILVLAVAFVWVVIIALFVASSKQLRKNKTPIGKITVRNMGDNPTMILEVRNVATGITKRVDFELQPGNSKTIDLGA